MNKRQDERTKGKAITKAQQTKADSLINKVFDIFRSEGWSDTSIVAVLNRALFAGMQAGFGISEAQASEILTQLMAQQMSAGIPVEVSNDWHKILGAFPEGTDTNVVMAVLTVALQAVMSTKVGESKASEIIETLMLAQSRCWSEAAFQTN